MYISLLCMYMYFVSEWSEIPVLYIYRDFYNCTVRKSENYGSLRAKTAIKTAPIVIAVVYTTPRVLFLAV